MFSNSSMAVGRPRFQLDDVAPTRLQGRAPVVVALDGTPFAERVIPVASSLAKRWNAPLRLIHVRNPVEDAQRMDTVVIDNQKSLTVETRSGVYLKTLANSLRSNGLSVTCDTVLGTNIEDTLRSHCQTAGVLVMARTDRSMFSRIWSGSVTDRLIGRLTVPLVLVPAESKDWALSNASQLGEFNRMLIHLDGSDASDNVIDNAIAIASEGARGHLLRVLSLSALYALGRGGLSYEPDVRNEAWRGLFRAKRKLERQGITGKSQLIYAGQNAGSAVVERARAMQAQVIVVAAKRYLLPWWLRDAVADYVVRHATIPVLIVPEDKSPVTHSESHHADFTSN